MIIVEKNPGTKVDHEAIGTKVFFGDELMLNLTKYQRDWPVHVDVCCNRDDMLVVGIGDGLYYVAQIDIPPVEYGEGEAGGVAKALDMDEVTLTLWSLDELSLSPVV